jgi:hypothetical protein
MRKSKFSDSQIVPISRKAEAKFLWPTAAATWRQQKRLFSTGAAKYDDVSVNVPCVVARLGKGCG